jgi:hypothetical protein
MASWIPAAIAAAGSVIGGVAGSKAQSSALERSREDVLGAYNTTNQALTGAYNQAYPYLNQALQQGSANNLWAYNTGLGAKTAGTNNALASLASGYNNSLSRLSPYSGMGNNALTALNSKFFGGNSGVPAGGQMNFPSANYTSSPPPSFTGTGPGGSPLPGPLFQMPQGANTTEATSRDQRISSAERDAGGFKGNTLSRLASGSLFGLWDANKGQSKVGASAGIDEASNIIWKELYPQYKAGTMTAEQFKAAADSTLASWAKTLPGNVNKNSIEDQLFWFNQDPNGLKSQYGIPFDFEIPGYSAVRHG